MRRVVFAFWCAVTLVGSGHAEQLWSQPSVRSTTGTTSTTGEGFRMSDYFRSVGPGPGDTSTGSVAT